MKFSTATQSLYHRTGILLKTQSSAAAKAHGWSVLAFWVCTILSITATGAISTKCGESRWKLCESIDEWGGWETGLVQQDQKIFKTILDIRCNIHIHLLTSLKLARYRWTATLHIALRNCVNETVWAISSLSRKWRCIRCDKPFHCSVSAGLYAHFLRNRTHSRNPTDFSKNFIESNSKKISIIRIVELCQVLKREFQRNFISILHWIFLSRIKFHFQIIIRIFFLWKARVVFCETEIFLLHKFSSFRNFPGNFDKFPIGFCIFESWGNRLAS